MLVFTNRNLNARPNASAYERSFTPGGTRLAVASVSPGTAPSRWNVSDHDDDVSDVDALNLLLPLFTGTRPICVYLHGNSNTPAACFSRCSALQALYDVEVIGFSWPSEGFLSNGSRVPGVTSAATSAVAEDDLMAIRADNRTEGSIQQIVWRFQQAKTNAQNSVDALARFFRLLGTARLHANVQRFTVAAHSLGSHLLQYSLEVPGAGESVATAHNVALLAPCCRAAGHAAWLHKLRPKGQVFVTYNKGDNVLFGAFVADSGQAKLGVDPGAQLLRNGAVRYISFTNAVVGFGGHRYFVQDDMPDKTAALFKRILGSSADIAVDEHPRQVYPVGCDIDGAVCYMGPPDPTEPPA